MSKLKELRAFAKGMNLEVEVTTVSSATGGKKGYAAIGTYGYTLLTCYAKNQKEAEAGLYEKVVKASSQMTKGTTTKECMTSYDICKELTTLVPTLKWELLDRPDIGAAHHDDKSKWYVVLDANGLVLVNYSGKNWSVRGVGSSVADALGHLRATLQETTGYMSVGIKVLGGS